MTHKIISISIKLNKEYGLVVRAKYVRDLMRSHSFEWKHSGGKLRERGADSLSDAELLAILIATGVKGKSAEKIAEDVLAKFNSFRGMANQPFSKFLEIRGMGEVKTIRIAAAFEIARRIVNEVFKDYEKT